MINKLNKMWKELHNELILLSNYTLTNPREYTLESDNHKVIIELQDSKSSTKNEKEVVVNIFVGLKWNNSLINHHDGWNYQQCRLLENSEQDKWWKIQSELDIEILKNELIKQLKDTGNSFINMCSTHKGAFEWIKEQQTPTETMLYAQDVVGKDELKEMIIDWVQTYPRGNTLIDFFDWLESTKCFPKNEIETIKRKSWQTPEIYKNYIDTWVRQQRL